MKDNAQQTTPRVNLSEGPTEEQHARYSEYYDWLYKVVRTDAAELMRENKGIQWSDATFAALVSRSAAELFLLRERMADAEEKIAHLTKLLGK